MSLPELQLGPIERATAPGTRQTEATAFVTNFDGELPEHRVVLSAWRTDPSDRRAAGVSVSFSYNEAAVLGTPARPVLSDTILVRAGSLENALAKGGRHFAEVINAQPQWEPVRTRLRAPRPQHP